jgi:hypothetical protein
MILQPAKPGDHRAGKRTRIEHMKTRRWMKTLLEEAKKTEKEHQAGLVARHPSQAWHGKAAKGHGGRIIPPRNLMRKGGPKAAFRRFEGAALSRWPEDPAACTRSSSSIRRPTPPRSAASHRRSRARSAAAPARNSASRRSVAPIAGRGRHRPMESPAKATSSRITGSGFRSGPRNRGYAPAPADARPRTTPAPHADGCSAPCASGRRRSGATPRETCCATATGPCPAGHGATRRIARPEAPRRHGRCAKTSRSPCPRRPGPPPPAGARRRGSAGRPRRSGPHRPTLPQGLHGRGEAR